MNAHLTFTIDKLSLHLLRSILYSKNCLVPVSINLTAADLLIVGKIRIEAAEEANKRINR